MLGKQRPRELVDRLCTDGHGAAEVLVKRGRTRRSELGVQGPVSVLTVESGWAVRAGGASGSFFCCGTGNPPLTFGWPSGTGAGLRLPEPGQITRWTPDPSIEAPLFVEGEAKGLVDGISRELGRQLIGARLLRAVLDDGSSETYLTSSRGIDVGYRSRLATLHLEAVLGTDPATRTVVELAQREAGAFQPRAVAGQLADGLSVRSGDPGPQRERGEMVLGPTVGARLLLALAPLWLGSDAAPRAAALTDRHDRLGSERLTIVDNGRLAGGALEAPVDGEGMPTRRSAIIEQGRFLQPLVDWRQTEHSSWRAVGCMRRASWRDTPQLGLSHFYIEPDEQVAATDLIAAVARGFYLLDTLGRVRIDFDADRFAVPVCGFSLVQGQARETIARSWLCGGVGALLRGIRGVARDLAFTPEGAMVGAPSLLVRGLELRREL